MADLLGAGLDWLDQQRERFLTRPVRYRTRTTESSIASKSFMSTAPRPQT